METGKLKIVKSQSSADEYFGLMAKKYGSSAAAQTFYADTQKGLDKVMADTNVKPTFFHAYFDKRLVAHIALIPVSGQHAFFGFFECEGEGFLKPLWDELIKETKAIGVKKLFGPVNGTIWHPYRFVVKSSEEPFFPSEPVTDIQYFRWFSRLNPTDIIEYHSAFRKDLSPILNATKSSYQFAVANGIELKNEAPDQHNIQELYKLAVDVFSVNPGYTPLSLQEFVTLYSSEKLDRSKSVLYTARHQGALIGFCLNLIWDNALIMKTIAVIPEYQQKGIGNALVHKVHIDAVSNGLEKVIYALIRKDNNVKHFTTEKVIIFREYAALQFEL